MENGGSSFDYKSPNTTSQAATAEAAEQQACMSGPAPPVSSLGKVGHSGCVLILPYLDPRYVFQSKTIVIFQREA